MKNILFVFILFALTHSLKAQQSGSFTDVRNGKVYKTVKIGNQTWMAENLVYKPDNINCWSYLNDKQNATKYGYLYLWPISKEVCPSGWNLPTKSDFDTLLINLGGTETNTYKALKVGGNSGFNALQGGWRYTSGMFYSIGEYGYWWSSTEADSNRVWHLCFFSDDKKARVDNSENGLGMSVRCIKSR